MRSDTDIDPDTSTGFGRLLSLPGCVLSTLNPWMPLDFERLPQGEKQTAGASASSAATSAAGGQEGRGSGTSRPKTDADPKLAYEAAARAMMMEGPGRSAISMEVTVRGEGLGFKVTGLGAER